MVELPVGPLPRVYEHFIVFAAFATGAIASMVIAGEWQAVIGSGWCFAAIAWFPTAILEFFRRMGVERFLFSSALLSAIAGFDGFLRLVRQSSGGC